jgi:hypothetical protein
VRAYTVGSGGNYASLTLAGGAFDALNSNGASCNITLSIISDLTSETGAVALNELAGGFAVLIQPSGGPRTHLRHLGGQRRPHHPERRRQRDHRRLPGRRRGERDLTVTNNQAGGVVIWLKSANAGNGCSNNTFRNLRLNGTGSAAAGMTVAGILSSSNIFGNAADAPHNNNKVLSCTMFHVQNGLFLFRERHHPGPELGDLRQLLRVHPGRRQADLPGHVPGNAQNFVIQRNTIFGISSSTATSSTMTGSRSSASPTVGPSPATRSATSSRNNTTGWEATGSSWVPPARRPTSWWPTT